MLASAAMRDEAWRSPSLWAALLAIIPRLASPGVVLGPAVFASVVAALGSVGCTTGASVREGAESKSEGAAWVRRAVQAHGAARLAEATVDFSFRGTPHRMTRSGGRFRFERWPRPDQHEVLTNEGYALFVNGERAKLSAAAAAARARSLNSVVYFASLPYVLEDPAVNAVHAGQQEVDGETYDVLEVTFDLEGGGEDHDDRFRYWLDPESGELELMAYSFTRGEGGVRLRVRTSTVGAGGVTFVNWKNFGDPNADTPLSQLPKLWLQGELPELSEILLDDIRVTAPRREDLGRSNRAKPQLRRKG